MATVTKIKRALQALVIITFTGNFVVQGRLINTYLASSPPKPNPEAGHTYAFRAHGNIVYVTERQRTLYDRVRWGRGLLAAVCIIGMLYADQV